MIWLRAAELHLRLLRLWREPAPEPLGDEMPQFRLLMCWAIALEIFVALNVYAFLWSHAQL